jgi:hypothetical protein
MRIALVAAVALALVLGCRTVRIQPRPPIAVPSELTLEQVELAILAAVANESPAVAITPGSEGSVARIEAAKIGALRSQKPAGDGWFPESIEPDAIVATFQKAHFSLRVRIRYTQYEVITEILDSRHLKQSRSAIHFRAIEWLEELETRIRRSLGALAVLRSGTGIEDPGAMLD